MCIICSNKVSLLIPDNVCIESMSITINRRTLDKCQANIDILQDNIQV